MGSPPTGSSSAPTSTRTRAASARCSRRTGTAAARASPASPAPGTATRAPGAHASPRRREVRTLTSLLQTSLAADILGPAANGSLAEAADRIRGERALIAQRPPAPEESRPEASPIEAPEVEPTIRRRLETGERHRAAELRTRLRWAWMRPTRRYDEFKDLVAAAEEQLSEARAGDELGARAVEHAG